MEQADRSLTGIVCNIQKFSVNDGPGIRTVVFLKGCPLRCRWCANPESQWTRPQLLWDRGKCLACGRCAQVCPHGALRLDDGEVRVEHPRCETCGLCVSRCVGRALEIRGTRRSVADVLAVVLQDRVFYEEGGGGLTLSGGELLAQPEFARALALAAREEGLHTCCETTGCAEPAVFDRVMDCMDEILFDVKHWDAEKHRAGTGVSQALPLLNLRRSLERGRQVLPRIPVIPGFNDSMEDADRLARLLRELGAQRCQLLPFHQFGENKYDMLGRDYAYANAAALHREELESYRLAFAEQGVQAFF